MNTRERLLAALNWEEPDKVPLTIYDWMLPRGSMERGLREAGVGLIMRPAAHQVEHREVAFHSTEYWESGRKYIRKAIQTPLGEIYQILEPESAYDTSFWIKEHFIKTPQDYRIMEFYINDAVYHDNYGYLHEAVRRIGSDGIVYVRIAKTPVQEMLYQMMGLERFSIDFHERLDLFDSLHATMQKRYEEVFDLAAGAPVEILLFGDNITSDVVGKDRFRKYCMPMYQRMKEKLVGTDKKLAVHMDGRLASIKDDIGNAQFDIIEAITPPPMGDVSIKEARDIWPDKALWINFTSSMHIESSETIADHTRQLLLEAGTKKGFAISITEDAPVVDLERSLGVISQILNE